MKLIIDISEEELEIIRTNISKSPSDFRIIDGTPLQAELEEIKAEIQSERNNHQEVGKYTYTAGLKVAMDLIDNHIKENK